MGSRGAGESGSMVSPMISFAVSAAVLSSIGACWPNALHLRHWPMIVDIARSAKREAERETGGI